MIERRNNTFLFILCLNLIIVTVSREIGDFRKKFTEIHPTEIIDSVKKSFDSIKENDFSSVTEKEIGDKNSSIEEEEKAAVTDFEDNNATEKADDEIVLSNEDIEDDAKTEKVHLDENEKLEPKKSDDETKIMDEIDDDSDDDKKTKIEDKIDEDSDDDKLDEDEQPSEKIDNSEATFNTNRDNLIKTEEDMAFGSDVVLNDDEKTINDTLMEAKFKEIDEGFADEGKFLPRANFLKVKDDIERSKVFKIINKMPKGCLLHAHDVGTVSQRFVLYNVTYRPSLYVCDLNGKLQLRFFDNPDSECNWKLLSELRETPESEKEINQRIQQHISMLTENPEDDYPDGDKAWIKFQSIFEFLGSFMRYRPVYEDYYYQLLQENYDDKVLYVELRASLPKIYELNGKIYKPIEVVKIIKDVVDRFVEEHPDFVGVKIIYSKRRLISNEKLQKYLQTFQEIKDAYPNFVAGFDLVGQENKGLPLKNFTKQLTTFRNDYQTFFHAGETDWYGLSADENLIDAVLLNTRRIGHGYALPKHPKVMELVKKKNIAIEVNPISNQILNLVADLRNHPASILFAEDYPVVVASDDPGLWGAQGLSYDFYETFMGIMSRSADLRALIQLGYNSIVYSAMNDDEKEKALDIFDDQWSEFVENFDETEY
ncbi:adenosine deaminase 2-like isoform X2 [Leptopilina boulardi]|uniref:adenosine deaminase 2-like isoform X2 n=1 Tax=Leptopilina boulardi TaxID=63433 RepID=UPI0021F60FFE|nr:adenosine deaminase 2-like isoform X2 [Leptopilina boulardi]